MAEVEFHSTERPVLFHVDENKNVSDQEVLSPIPNVVDNTELKTISFENEEENVTCDILNQTVVLDSNYANLSKEMLENFPKPSSECLNNSTLIPDSSFEVINELDTTQDLKYKTPINLMDTSNLNEIEDNIFNKGNDNVFVHPSEVFQPLVDLNQDVIGMKDEEFHDAVQYFKNPSDFDCLSNVGSSNSESSFTRCSLYMNFDPLHAGKQAVKPTNINENSLDLPAVIKYAADQEVTSAIIDNSVDLPAVTEHAVEQEQSSTDIDNSVGLPAVKEQAVELEDKSANIVNSMVLPAVTEHLVKQEAASTNVDNSLGLTAATEENVDGSIFIKEEIISISDDVHAISPIVKNKDFVSKVFDNTLISFESPIKVKESSVVEENKPVPKLYSQEEFAQALKAEELKQQQILLRKQQELEKKEQECERKTQEAESKLKESERKVFSLSKLSRTWHMIINEILNEGILKNQQELSHLRVEKEAAETALEKQKSDLKTAQDDLQNVEGAFADFHKRYETLKAVIKTSQENESHLKLQIEEMQSKIEEKEKMYDMLQSRAQTSLDNANNEIVNAKKTFEAQITVLNAQTKKDKMKISSLEDNNKQLKDENEKLYVMCDDLMAKVKEKY